MKNNITQQEFDEIKDLVNKATSAYTKASAVSYIKQLEIRQSLYGGYLATVYSRLTASVKRVSGKVSDKERYLSFCEQDLENIKQCII